jgi:hypothetical protein
MRNASYGGLVRLYSRILDHTKISMCRHMDFSVSTPLSVLWCGKCCEQGCTYHAETQLEVSLNCPTTSTLMRYGIHQVLAPQQAGQHVILKIRRTDQTHLVTKSRLRSWSSRLHWSQ